MSESRGSVVENPSSSSLQRTEMLAEVSKWRTQVPEDGKTQGLGIRWFVNNSMMEVAEHPWRKPSCHMRPSH